MPNKLLFPHAKITKEDLISYYKRIAPYMLPYMKNHPITMQRFPNGIEAESFFQKNAPDYFPSWIKRAPIKAQDSHIVNYVICNNAKTLAYLANQGCIVMHSWLSKVPNLHNPDRIVFDLDPSGTISFFDLQNGAEKLKSVLDTLKLKSIPMITGSRGIHIIIPIKPVHAFEITHDFSKKIAQYLVTENPDLFTLQMAKAKRTNHIFLDYLRNSYGALSVLPYSVRAVEVAAIATPVTWDELFSDTMHAQKYTIKTIFKRSLSKDLLISPRQTLKRAIEASTKLF